MIFHLTLEHPKAVPALLDSYSSGMRATDPMAIEADTLRRNHRIGLRKGSRRE